MNRVFEPFYRIASRTSEGSGLGLYVVKLLTDQLGFDIKAELDNDLFFVEITIKE